MQGQSILIRADGSPALGMGHISRCMALAQTCSSNNVNVLFACQGAASEVRNTIVGAGFQLLDIETETHDIHAEASAISELAKRYDVQWLIIDHPTIMIEHEILIRQRCLCEVVVIDGQFRQHQCDVLVNPNAFATYENCRNTVSSECDILAGYQYFLLNDDYLKMGASSGYSPVTAASNRILITLGGSDPENCTLKLCHELAATDFGHHEPVFDIVLGPANQHRQTIEDFLAVADSTRFVAHLAPENLVGLLQACSICVSAGGITLGEAAYLGKSIIGIAILENQHRTIDSMGEMGALLVSEPGSVATHCKYLLDNVDERKRLEACASALVDGFGKQRIADRLWNRVKPEG